MDTMRALLRGLWALSCAALLAGCSAIGLQRDHTGADAGRVLIGIGAAENTSFSQYTLHYRRIGREAEAAPFKGAFVMHQRSVIHRAWQTRDYDVPGEAGIVVVQAIPAGDYEIYNFEISDSGGTHTTRAWSRHPFSIRFSVRAGEAVYLGNYQANRIGAGALFVVSNRLDRKLAIAREGEGAARGRCQRHAGRARAAEPLLRRRLGAAGALSGGGPRRRARSCAGAQRRAGAPRRLHRSSCRHRMLPSVSSNHAAFSAPSTQTCSTVFSPGRS